jgi:CO dehydrogenase/acetyl-CoA synthase beta subunit
MCTAGSQRPNRMPEDIPDKILDRIPEDMPDKIP